MTTDHQAQELTVTLGRTVFNANTGTKGKRGAEMNVSMDFDLMDIKPEFRNRQVEYFVAIGVLYHLKQCTNRVNDFVKAGLEKGEPMPIANQEKMARELMLKRWAEVCEGRSGKKIETTMSALDRRALELIERALTAANAAKGVKMSEAQYRQLAKDVLATPDGEAFREEAQIQLAAEANNAAKASAALAKFL